ncbi:MAG: CsbD family protein [Lysobacteraceae bacterium]
MNSDTIKGQWKQLNGRIKAQWGKLTDDDLTVAEGNGEYLAGKVQERYGLTKELALKQVEEFEKTIRHS